MLRRCPSLAWQTLLYHQLSYFCPKDLCHAITYSCNTDHYIENYIPLAPHDLKGNE